MSSIWRGVCRGRAPGAPGALGADSTLAGFVWHGVELGCVLRANCCGPGPLAFFACRLSCPPLFVGGPLQLLPGSTVLIGEGVVWLGATFRARAADA